VRSTRDMEVRRPDDDVAASEIAAFAYCAKAWHLERVAGAQASDDSTRIRSAGTAHHARHGSSVRLGSWLGRHSLWVVPALLLLAGALGALALLLG
jgi:hypothetical protein